MPGENNLTLFTLLSAMQILLICEELVDLSNMIIAPCPLQARLTSLAIFLQLLSHPSDETHKVPAIPWGISQLPKLYHPAVVLW